MKTRDEMEWVSYLREREVEEADSEQYQLRQ